MFFGCLNVTVWRIKNIEQEGKFNICNNINMKGGNEKAKK